MLTTLIARDITTKLYAMNKKVRILILKNIYIPGNGADHSDCQGRHVICCEQECRDLDPLTLVFLATMLASLLDRVMNTKMYAAN